MKQIYGCVFLCIMVLSLSHTGLAATRFAVASGNWSATSTWSATRGGSSGAAVPTSADSVIIPSSWTVTVASSPASCNALNVESGGTIKGNTALPTSSIVYVRVYGLTVTVNGTWGVVSPGDNLSMELYGNVTILGSGAKYFARIRPGSSQAGKTCTIDCDLTAFYNGSSGSGGSAIYTDNNGANDGTTFIIKAGRTLTLGDKAYLGMSSSGSTDGASSGTINVYGTVNMGTASTLVLSVASGKTSNLNVYSGGVVNLGGNLYAPSSSAGTINVSVASGASMVGASSTSYYYNIGKATLTLNGTLDFNGTSTSTRNIGTATVSSTGKLRYKDGTTSSGTITLNSGSTVEYYGSSSISVSGASSFRNLLINNSAGVSFSSDVTVNDTLALSSGIVTAGTSVYIASGGTVTRTGGHVNGILKKYIATGATSSTFEVGDATNYTPVTVAFSSVSAAGDLSVKSNSGSHPSILASGINSGKGVARYWTIANSGITFDNYSATFTFVPGDITAGASTSSFISQYYNGSAWSSTLTMGTLTSTSTQVTGVTAIGDFAIGEAATSDPTISIAGALSAFANTAVGSVSSEQSYTVAGVNLIADISIAPPTGFEISTTSSSGTGFVATNPIVLTQSGGSVSSTTIYVRFAPVASGNISGNIVHTSTGASAQNQAASGLALATEPTTSASAVTFSNIGQTTMTVSWTNGSGSNRLVLARVNSAVANMPTDATSYTASAVYGSGTVVGSSYVVYNGTGNSVDISGLTEGNPYYFSVFEFSGSGGTENYRTTSPATGAHGANSVVSAGVTGNWSSTSSWVGGILPTSVDNVKIGSGSTITIDDANAVCKDLSFTSSSSSKIAFGASGVLNIYGDFYCVAANTASGWAAGGKLRFTGSAAVQTLMGLSTSKSGTSQFPFMEVVVDKSAGKVATQIAVDADNTFSLGTSLEIVNGTFELGQKDDIQGVGLDLTTATLPTITVQSGGTFTMLAGASHIRSGTSSSNSIGKMTLYGTAEISSTSTLQINIGGVDIQDGGTLRLMSGWSTSAAGLNNTGTITINNGGTLRFSTTSSNMWNAGSSIVLNSGGIILSTITTAMTLPASLTDNGGIFRFSYVDQSGIPARTYTNLELAGSGVKSLSGAVTINGTLSIMGTASLDVSGGSLTYGPSATLQYGDSGQSTAQTTTDAELPADGGPANVAIYNSGGVTLHASRSISGNLNLIQGSLSTGANTLTLGSDATISGEAAGKYVVGNLQTTRSLSGSSGVDIAGMGVALNPNGNDLGSTTIVRTSGSAGYVNQGDGSINRRWKITPTSQPSTPVDVTLGWVSSDDNGKAIASLSAWRSEDNGSTWFKIASGLNGSSRSVTFATSSFSDFTLTGNEELLPVELNTFASSVQGRVVKLEWATATEVNSYKFVVERSKDTQNNWSKVGEINASNYSNSPKNYSFTDNNVNTGSYSYRLKMVDNDGTYEYSKVVEASVAAPTEFKVSKNYPNPFNPSTKISYALPADANISIELYTITGQRIAVLLNETASAGYHDFSINMTPYNLSSGLYFYKFSGKEVLSGKNLNYVNKMIYLK